LDAVSQRILAAIVELTNRHGRPPTYREVLAHAGMHSHSCLSESLRKLEQEGQLQRLPGARNLIIPNGHLQPHRANR
jgi:SOS-response transcriptional repressor LexA